MVTTRTCSAILLCGAFVLAPLSGVLAQQATPVAPVVPPPPPPPVPSPEDALRARLAGTFAPMPGVPNQHEIEAGIERAVGALFFVIRPIARSRILAGNPLFSQVTIAFQGRVIDLNSPPVHARSTDDGAMSSMTGLDHERNNVTQRFDRGSLVQTCWNDAGRRVTRFTPSADGSQLTLAIEITAPQLPVPVRYTLRYVRR